MSKLIEMLRIGICPIGYLIMHVSGLNLVLEWIGKKRSGLERTGLERIDSKG